MYFKIIPPTSGKHQHEFCQIKTIRRGQVLKRLRWHLQLPKCVLVVLKSILDADNCNLRIKLPAESWSFSLYNWNWCFISYLHIRIFFNVSEATASTGSTTFATYTTQICINFLQLRVNSLDLYVYKYYVLLVFARCEIRWYRRGKINSVLILSIVLTFDRTKPWFCKLVLSYWNSTYYFAERASVRNKMDRRGFETNELAKAFAQIVWTCCSCTFLKN